MSERICSTCMHSIWCQTWADWKCKVKKRRIYPDSAFYGKCPDYKKRDKTFKESACQCEDCLKNEDLWIDDEDET